MKNSINSSGIIAIVLLSVGVLVAAQATLHQTYEAVLAGHGIPLTSLLIDLAAILLGVASVVIVRAFIPQ